MFQFLVSPFKKALIYGPFILSCKKKTGGTVQHEKVPIGQKREHISMVKQIIEAADDHD